MADGSVALRKWIARLRELGKLAANSASDVAKAIKTEQLAQIARGEGPDGRPWKLTQKGERPLANAGRALTVRVVGTVIVLRLMGHHARHHLGAVKGKTRRQILPTGKIPDPVIRAIARVVTGEFHRTMGGNS